MSTKYIPTIGLEIHAELKTKTKMFCNSVNDPDETEPNKNVCPICMGHPGTLPTLNMEAIKSVLKIGHAINANIADYTEWDRKNYFYPDIPKGYQISQYKYPLITGGKIKGVELTRIHLEEDTGSSIHDRGDFSLVNYNRAGVPLMELVTEPVIHDSKTAVEFAKELQLLLRYLDVAEANMEKGEMRVEANISVGPADENGNPKLDESGKPVFGTKVEVKNLNSFKSVEKAIEYEIARMIDLLEEGRADEIVQETRGWDESNQSTYTQRRKETSDDYRYFPDPDLPKLKISEIPEFAPEILRAEMSELPWERREKLLSLGLNADQAEFFVTNSVFYNLFASVKEKFKGEQDKIKLSANYITSDLVSLLKNSPERISNFTPEVIFELIQMIAQGEISSRGAKDILATILEKGGTPKNIAEEHGLLQKSDEGELEKIVDQIISENQKVVDEFKAGKEASLQFLIGQGMKATRGSANPKVLSDIFRRKI